MITSESLADLRYAVMHAKDIVRNADQYAFELKDDWHYFSGHILRQLHKQLPRVIDHAIDTYKYANMYLIQETVAHWDNPGLLQEGSTTQYVTSTERVKRLPDGSYWLTCKLYTVEVVDETFGLVARGPTSGFYNASLKWLDEHYPGLSMKIDVLTAMGSDADETAKFCLTEAVGSVQITDLSHVGFDFSWLDGEPAVNLND